MTPEEALPLVMMMLDHVEPPSGWRRQRGPNEPAPQVAAAILWAEVFSERRVTPEQARRACLRYLAQPLTSTYPLRWPEPGKLVALTDAGEAVLYLGSDRDADCALALVSRRMRDLAYAPVYGTGRTLDPGDPYRDEALWAALHAVGGPDEWGNRDEGDRVTEARFRAAYVAARQQQRNQGDAVFYTSEALAQRPRPAIREVERKAIPFDPNRRKDS